jgi:hypothetical protein
MPQVKNKIIINNGGARAYYQIIKGWFKGIATTMDNGEFLADEMEEHGWLQEPDALKFLEEQETDCEAIDDACAQFIEALDTFHANQMSRNDRMRRWVDSMLSKPPTP